MRSSALLLASLLAGTASPHAVATPTSLTATMQAAADNTRVQAARWRAQAADATARAAWRGSWAPSLDLQAQAARRDQLSTIDTPAGAFTLGDRDVYEATLSLRQPLLDLSNQAYGAPASQRVAQAQHQQVLRQQRVQAAAAASHYLDWLALEAQRQAILSLQDSLQLRAARVRNQSTAGRALQADVLDMDVAVTEARQQLVEIEAQQTVLRQDLTRLTGRPIQPRDVRPPDNAADHLQTPDWAEVFAQRRDLQALRLQRESQRLLASAERASAWPTLGTAVPWTQTSSNCRPRSGSRLPRPRRRSAPQSAWPNWRNRLSPRARPVARSASLATRRAGPPWMKSWTPKPPTHGNAHRPPLRGIVCAAP